MTFFSRKNSFSDSENEKSEKGEKIAMNPSPSQYASSSPSFVCAFAVAFGFAARQCCCRRSILGLAGGVGEAGTEPSPAAAECFSFFSVAQGTLQSCKNLFSTAQRRQTSTPDLCLSFWSKQPRQVYSTLCNL